MDPINSTPIVPQPAVSLPTAPTISPTVPAIAQSICVKGIPRTNKVFMVISLILVLGLDLVILLVSGFSLLPFWIVMLVVLGIFAVFFYLENYVFSKKFADTKSALDPWISAIIVARNIIFVLNFIPLIQILGLALLGGVLAFIPAVLLGGSNGLGGIGSLGGLGTMALLTPALLLLYVVLIAFRFSVTKQQSAIK